MVYKITIFNQLKGLLGVIIGVPLVGLLMYYLYQAMGEFSAATTIGFIYFGIVYFITLFIHCEYYILNKGEIMIIDEDKKTVSFGAEIHVHFEDIEKITVFMTQLQYYKSSYLWVLPSDSYHYAVIKFNHGKEFIFTSLMASNVEDTMKKITGVQPERKLRPIPSPMLSKLIG